MSDPPMTVVETPEFIANARKLMSDDERGRLIDHLARAPTAGDVIPGAGGLRKLRWALAGRGKSGGARVIYFFHDPGLPLFLLAAYAKSRSADLKPADRSVFKALTARLIESYGEWKP